jgi:VWFA-related protein
MKIRTLTLPSLLAAALSALILSAAHATAQTAAPAAASPATPSPATPATGMPISLSVTVVDKKGDPVKNFTPADLTLTDNGHLQTITSFALAQPSPVTFGILGQTSTNLHTELGDERLASVHFVDHTLPGTDDKAFVVQFAREVDLLEDPTATVNKLHDAINQLGSPQFGNQSSTGDSSSDQTTQHSGGSAGGTLYDAIYLASNEILKKQPGRHVIVLIGDGIDRDSKETVNDAIEAAQAAHTAIFAIYYKGEEEKTNNPNQNTGRRGGTGGGGYPGGGGGYPGGGGGYPGGGGGYPGGGGGGGRRGGQTPSSEPHIDGKEILEHICSATGGYMVEGKKDKADDSYAKISALLKNQYTLSYAPDKDAADSVSHHLTLTSKKTDVWALVQQDYSTQ